MSLREQVDKILYDANRYGWSREKMTDAILDLKVTTWDKPFNPTWKKVIKTLRELEGE